RDVRWAGADGGSLAEVHDLVFFYLHRFRRAPRRYLDGFDERFGVGGPVDELEVRVGIEECLDSLARAVVPPWGADPTMLADAFYVGTLLSGRTVSEALPRGVAAAEEWRRRG